ncbi:MAG: (d)CMP kinase [Bacteroides sp.]|nr:(d)CMP kinase [Bacteroides sp.]MCM1414195.1 (d)CMP kinase [Bacteroides sp.]MCM1472017.1 (d)CMP kinase [Bacteroides sp.]
MQEKPLITIAIDGYSSSGKSSMARELARRIGYRYIDSGAMYRAVALYALRHGMIRNDQSVDQDALIKALPDIHIGFEVTPKGQNTTLNGENVEKEIRSMAVSNCVSPVATIPAVRHALVEKQREMGSHKGIVMDGRDIGTTVFPDAEMKVFVTASAQTRAQRRLSELIDKGVATSFEEVLANVISRDHIDETREESPLRKAPDAVVLDNSIMDIETQNQWLLDLYNHIVDNR